MVADFLFPTPIDMWTAVPDPTSTPTRRFPQAQETVPASFPYPGNTDESDNFWEKLANGAKAGIAITIVITVLAVIAFSAWFCCNCCGRRRRKPSLAGNPRNNNVWPLRTIQHRGPHDLAAPPLEAPPPAYEEAVRPSQQRFPTSLPNTREEDAGVVADGKTPLSEIPFEDIVLDHASSQSSSSRTFEQSHHSLGGDTRGHTNS